MEKNLNLSCSLSRRDFIEKLAYTTFGVSVLRTPSLAQDVPSAFFGKAKHVIYIYNNGGMSHLDSFDPKGENVMGGVKSVQSSGDFQVSEYFKELAKHGDKFSLLRGMTSKTGAHSQGQYLMRTSYAKNSLTIHPAMGATSSYLLGKSHDSIPDNILISGDNDHPREGYLDKKFTPLPIINPNEGLRFSKLSVSESGLNNRLSVLNALDRNFREGYGVKDVNSYNVLYDETLKLLKSEDLDSFDLNKETPENRDRYGRSNFGQGCLLAKRLISRGVRYIEIGDGGWDMHNDISTAMTNKAEYYDKALASLFSDLSESGLLKETLVVIATEFGRTIDSKNENNLLGLNKNEGRDHHPSAFSCLIGGCGLGGKVVGKTDENGQKVVERPTEIGELNATIGHLLGIRHDHIWMSPSNRPFTIGNKAEPIKELIG
jgi:hypothetical protein